MCSAKANTPLRPPPSERRVLCAGDLLQMIKGCSAKPAHAARHGYIIYKLRWPRNRPCNAITLVRGTRPRGHPVRGTRQSGHRSRGKRQRGHPAGDTPAANFALSRPRKTRPATAPQHVISSEARNTAAAACRPCAVEKSPGYDIKA